MDKIILNKTAVHKELTSKPPTIFVHNNIINALITNKNSPKVTIVTGKVRITNIGFTKIFSNPKTTATIIDVVKLATETPGIKCAIIITKIEVIRILMIRFIDSVLMNNKCI